MVPAELVLCVALTCLSVGLIAGAWLERRRLRRERERLAGRERRCREWARQCGLRALDGAEARERARQNAERFGPSPRGLRDPDVPPGD